MATAGMFLTHSWSSRIERHFNRLVEECGDGIAWQVVRGPTGVADGVPAEAAGEAVLGPRFEQMRSNGGVQGGFMDTAIWPHLLALDADFTWIMEYDVDFAGDWRKFFDQFAADAADLLAADVAPRRSLEDWYSWGSAAAPPHVLPEHMFRAFLPLMRVSRQLAHEYAGAMQDPRWAGHYEFTIPTAAVSAGLVVKDIRRNPRPSRLKDRRKRNYSGRSFAWRPSRDLYFVEAPESFPEADVLYHPVKGGVPEWGEKPILRQNR